MEVSDIISFHRTWNDTELLSLAASAETKSEHPLGKAIVAFAKEKGIPMTESKNFKMTAGKGIIALSDILRTESKDMISKLNAMNTKTVLLTGDNQKVADYFAGQTGITEVHAELLPEEKVRSIEKLQAEKKWFV